MLSRPDVFECQKRYKKASGKKWRYDAGLLEISLSRRMCGLSKRYFWKAERFGLKSQTRPGEAVNLLAGAIVPFDNHIRFMFARIFVYAQGGIQKIKKWLDTSVESCVPVDNKNSKLSFFVILATSRNQLWER